MRQRTAYGKWQSETVPCVGSRLRGLTSTSWWAAAIDKPAGVEDIDVNSPSFLASQPQVVPFHDLEELPNLVRLGLSAIPRLAFEPYEG